MNLFFNLLLYCSIGFIIWRLVLKKSAYPDIVQRHLTWSHAIILYYVLVNAVGALDNLVWLIRNHLEIIACFNLQSNVIGSPSIATAMIIGSLAGTPLFLICNQMAKRQRSILKWYFVLWPVSFLCLDVYKRQA